MFGFHGEESVTHFVLCLVCTPLNQQQDCFLSCAVSELAASWCWWVEVFILCCSIRCVALANLSLHCCKELLTLSIQIDNINSDILWSSSWSVTNSSTVVEIRTSCVCSNLIGWLNHILVSLSVQSTHCCSMLPLMSSLLSPPLLVRLVVLLRLPHLTWFSFLVFWLVTRFW